MPKTRFSTELIGEFSLTAGANNESRAEKRARVASQLRDRYGRWVEMGRGVKFKVRLPNGKYHSALGPFTGDMTPDGRGYVKVENDPYLPNGDYPVSSDNAQQYIALLTEEDLKEQGIELGKDVDGNVVTAREDSVIPNLADLVEEVKPTQSLELQTEPITARKVESLWDSEGKDLDEEASTENIYNLMLQEGVTSEDIAKLNPVFLELLEFKKNRGRTSPTDSKDWALGAILNLRREWNGSPSAYGSIQALQQVAKRVFNLEGTSEAPDDLEKAQPFMKNEKVYEAFLRAAYKDTQKFFADRGIKKLSLYRGIINSEDNSSLKEPTKIVYAKVRPLSSWSVSFSTGSAYAGLYGLFMRTEVPVSQVLSTAFSGGMGTEIEKEVVVIGLPEQIMAVEGGQYRKLKQLDADFDASKPIEQEPAQIVEDSPVEAGLPEKISLSDLPDDTTDFDKKIFSSVFEQIKFDVSKTPNAEESYSLYEYQGPKYEGINKFARENPNYEGSENDQLSKSFTEETEIIQKIDNLFKKIKIADDTTVYRGAAISPSRYEALLKIQKGDMLIDDAYMSTSASPNVAKKFAYSLFDDDETKTPVIYKINLKAGQPAIRVKDYTTADDLEEAEILLARRSKIRVTNVSKTLFDPLTEDGDSVQVLIIEGDYESGLGYFNPADGKWYKDSAFTIPVVGD
jgi:hypothetical protein